MRPLAALLLCLAAGLAWAAGTYKVGDDVADAKLTTADGKETKLSSYEGNAVVLFFYRVTDARHAVDDAKKVEAIRKGRAKQKLTVVGVVRDAKTEDAKKFADENKLGLVQTVDPKSEFFGKFATKGNPWVAVLDGKRKLKYSAADVDDEAVETALTGILGAKDPAPDAGDKKK